MGYSLLWQRRHCAYMALQLQLSGERHQLLMLKFHHHATQFLIPLSLLKIATGLILFLAFVIQADILFTPVLVCLVYQYRGLYEICS